jgi:hypothetical protein
MTTLKTCANKRTSVRLFASDESGTMYFDIIIKTVIIVTILMTVIGFYDVFVKHQNITYMARRIVRAVELEGTASAAGAVFTELKAGLGLPDATYSIDRTGRIQIREDFTVTVTSPYVIRLFDPALGPPAELSVVFGARLTGVSERYWKPSEL